MDWVVGVGAVVGALFLVDRAVWLAARLGWLDRRRERPERFDGAPSAGIVLGPLVELYAPGHQHVIEEQDRQRLERHQDEAGAPPLGIDLDAGTARITSSSINAKTPRGSPPRMTEITRGLRSRR